MSRRLESDMPVGLKSCNWSWRTVDQEEEDHEVVRIPRRHIVCWDLFNIDKSTVFQVAKKISILLAGNVRHVLKFPTGVAELAAVNLQFYDKANFPGLVFTARTYLTRVLSSLPEPTRPRSCLHCPDLLHQDPIFNGRTYSTRVLSSLAGPTRPGSGLYCPDLLNQGLVFTGRTYSTKVLSSLAGPTRPVSCLSRFFSKLISV
uniref:Uncharacterized protein n=1 Tax=Timema bartmani TaxID=61472 RepID=A0A7R9FCI6_9NEOP|nr:unnamed protein product [Timema bartmani]